MAKTRFRVTKQQVLAAVGVLLLIVGIAGIGFLARWLQTQSSPKPQEVTTLPQIVTEVQDLQTEGKTEEAQQKIQQGLNDPGTSNEIKYMLHIQQGNAKFNNQDYAGAAEEFKKALALQETYEITNLLGETYELAGNTQEAITFYKRAYVLVTTDPNDPIAGEEKESLRKKIEALGGSV